MLSKDAGEALPVRVDNTGSWNKSELMQDSFLHTLPPEIAYPRVVATRKEGSQ